MFRLTSDPTLIDDVLGDAIGKPVDFGRHVHDIRSVTLDYKNGQGVHVLRHTRDGIYRVIMNGVRQEHQGKGVYLDMLIEGIGWLFDNTNATAWTASISGGDNPSWVERHKFIPGRVHQKGKFAFTVRQREDFIRPATARVIDNLGQDWLAAVVMEDAKAWGFAYLEPGQSPISIVSCTKPDNTPIAAWTTMLWRDRGIETKLLELAAQ